MTTPLSPARPLLAALVVLQAPLWSAGVALRLYDDLPDPVPTHWDLAGDVDGSLSLAGFTAGALAVVAAACVLALALVAASARRSPTASLAAAGATWLAWTPAALYVATLLAAAGAARAEDVGLPVVAIPLATVLPFVAALVVHRLLPHGPRCAPTAGSAGRDLPAVRSAGARALADGERITWVGQASSARLLAGGIVLGLAAVPLWFAAWPAAVAATFAAAALAWSHVLTVRVDETGASVSWGPARWPRVRIDLADVVSAGTGEIEPLRWGGWGYRRSRRGRAAVVRRGEGLVLTLRDGQQFAATVDRPEPAAELLDALVARRVADPR